MNADQIMENLRNYRDLLPHIERVALSQGINWSAEDDTLDLMLSPIDQDAHLIQGGLSNLSILRQHRRKS